jgi:MFS transporter, ACS family, D-galactonate transporter
MPKSTEPIIQQPQTSRPTRVRFFILALVAICTMINYLDRTVLSIAAPSLSKELRLDPAFLGIVFSAFS